MKTVRKSFTITGASSPGGHLDVGDTITMEVPEYNRWERLNQAARRWWYAIRRVDLGYFHANLSASRWLLGLAFTWEQPDRALFIHLGPLCIGFRRHDYYSESE